MSLFFAQYLQPLVEMGHEVLPGRSFLKERKEFSTTGEEDLLSVSEYTGVTRRRDSLEEGEHLSRAESLEGYRVVRRNDLVVNYMLAWKGALGISQLEGITSPAYAVFEPDQGKVVPRFLHAMLRSDLYRGYFRSESSGIIESRLRLYPEAMLSLKMVLPARARQEQIATFLDRETARIDALIEKKTRFIELLREKRQALITQAVTRGFDPTAPMKDSGVEWLGQVPDHWEVDRLGRHIEVLNGFAFASEGFSNDEADWKLLRGINVGPGEVRWDETVYWPRTANDRLDCFELKVGDIVVGLDRTWIEAGTRVARVKQSDLPALLLQRVAAIRCRQTLVEDFAFYLLASPMLKFALFADQTGLSVPHISSRQLEQFVLALPSTKEQQRICSYLKDALESIDRLAEACERSVQLLRERRSALITAAVTGQIDVRADQPAAAESPQPA